MSKGQLWLLPPPKPLVERFGLDFFRQLPDRPGVYLMCGPQEGILYVGKAKSLRRRLGNYRVANPERHSRCIIRLLHQVTRIEWDECPTETAAQHREAWLIATLNPKFNSAGKAWPLEGTARAKLTFQAQRLAMKNHLESALPKLRTPPAPGSHVEILGHPLI